MTRLLFLLPFVLTAAAAGAISQPNSTAVLSADGTSLLVILSFDPPSDQRPTFTLPDGRIINLHSVFKSSGVYDVATLKPRWQMDWYAYGWELRWSPDFRHIVRMNQHGFGSDWAIGFYEEGKLIKNYSCDDLLTSMNGAEYLPYTSSDWHYQWYEEFDLDASGRQVLLSTARRQRYFFKREIDLGLQEFYRFDLATGSMLDQRISDPHRPWRYLVIGVIVVTIVVVAFLLVRWRRQARRHAVSLVLGEARSHLN